MTKLSVNINKVATLRNARGGNTPDVIRFAMDCESYGADGITVHPRPDERHIRKQDVYDLKKVVATELNIEGYPGRGFVELVLAVRPAQVTLVPDAPDQLTSNHGWDTETSADEAIRGEEYTLREVIRLFKDAGIRVSVFVDADPAMVMGAKAIGADRVELYTGPFAEAYAETKQVPCEFVAAAEKARELGLGLNAGHDLSLTNLGAFLQMIPWVDEVSIGHALISEALYLGISETIKQYKRICCNQK